MKDGIFCITGKVNYDINLYRAMKRRKMRDSVSRKQDIALDYEIFLKAKSFF